VPVQSMYLQKVACRYSKMSINNKFNFLKNIGSVVLLSLGLILSSGVSVVKATGGSDTAGQTENQDKIELQLIQQVQNPENLEFEYTLRVKSLITTTSLRLNWDVVSKGGVIQPVTGTVMTDALDLNQGEEKFITKRFKPVTAGYVVINVTAIAYGPPPINDYYSYVSTGQFLIWESLEIAPKNSDYISAKNLLQITNVAKGVGLFFIVFLLIVIIYWRFKVWMSND
jgi:hypothetical protein